jgi:transketolase
VKARVVSMPGWSLFAAQDEAYRESVLPKSVRKRVTVEAGSSFGWREWAGDEGIVIGIDRFGASAPGDECMKHFGFTAEHVTSAALRLVGRNEDAAREYAGDSL